MIKYRLIKPEDEPMVSSWLERDEVHKSLGLTWKDVNEEGTVPFLISTEDDIPLLVARLHVSVRAAMQFNPDTPIAIARHANEVIDWMKDMAMKAKAKEIIIRPGGKAVRFSEKLGFKNFIGKFIGISNNKSS